jgi:hypothetical protein
MIRSHSSRSKRMEQRGVSAVELVPRLVRCAAVLDVGW